MQCIGIVAIIRDLVPRVLLLDTHHLLSVALRLHTHRTQSRSVSVSRKAVKVWLEQLDDHVLVLWVEKWQLAVVRHDLLSLDRV